VMIAEGICPTRRLGVRDRDHFQSLRGDPHDRLAIGRPILGRPSGKRVSPIARRLVGPTGAFAGFVQTSLDVGAFQEVYGAAANGDRGGPTLRRTGRHPARSLTPGGEPRGTDHTHRRDVRGTARSGEQQTPPADVAGRGRRAGRGTGLPLRPPAGPGGRARLRRGETRSVGLTRATTVGRSRGRVDRLSSTLADNRREAGGAGGPPSPAGEARHAVLARVSFGGSRRPRTRVGVRCRTDATRPPP